MSNAITRLREIEMPTVDAQRSAAAALAAFRATRRTGRPQSERPLAFVRLLALGVLSWLPILLMGAWLVTS